MTRFFAVGFYELHHDAQVELYSHDNEVSLDDADIVVFALPRAPAAFDTYLGKRCLSDDQSFRYKDQISRWNSELRLSVAAGKTVFIPLTSPEIVYVATGEVKQSGTGRNAQKTRVVTTITNLEVLPTQLEQIVSGTGDEIRATSRSQIIRQYWKRFARLSRYEIRFAPEKWITPLLTTKNPDQIVGGIIRYKGGGHVVLLPAIELGMPDDYEYDEGYDDDDRPNEGRHEPTGEYEFRINSIDFTRFLRDIHAELSGDVATPPPDWVQAAQFQTAAQLSMRRSLLKAQQAETQARERRERLLASLEEASILQGLLHAQGRPLEIAVIRALELMGVEAERVVDGDSEFDAVFAINGRRLLGEVEGRDNAAIAIGKITQLERNVAEDFARDGVDDYAHGVLFGNPERLVAPEERTRTFTEKCLASARRNRFATSPDTRDVRTSGLSRSKQGLCLRCCMSSCIGCGGGALG